MMQKLIELRDSLALIPTVKTCKVGLERNMTPDDYPIVRIVPTKLGFGDVIGTRQAEVLIYFGSPIEEFDEEPDAEGLVRLEKLYAALFEMEGAIIDGLTLLGGSYEDTVCDEDRIDTYKLMAVRAVVEG